MKSRKTTQHSRSLSPTTTAQEDIVTAGQRSINRIWEWTQAIIAIMITAAMIICEAFKVDSTAVRMAFALIIGFYFSRTNHQAIGGLGRKPEQKYIGR